jgi:hypothetical protein
MNGNRGPLPGKWTGKLFAFLFAVMAFTGFGQMPIFKRYFIAEIPGMGWSADYFLTHTIHYLGATAMLALFAYLAADYALSLRGSYRLSPAGWVRVLVLAGLVGTGAFRVAKNLPDVTFAPGFTMFIDISHLGLMMLYLTAAGLFTVTGRGWLRDRALSRIR